jgi:flavin reductase (DIM6/NTAB) family NADH-FMN oxidoreductase RutF
MPLSSGPVGPFPDGADPEEYDRLRRRVLWTMPSGLYILGSRAGERRNGMTCNWVTQLGFDPKLLGVSVEKEAVTHELVRKFTKPVEVDLEARTLNGFPFHDGATGAPILDQAVAYAECEVRSTLDVGSHTLFLGEVVDAGFQKPEDTAVLRMEDTRMNYGG